MKYADLHSLDRFDDYADITGNYSRGTRGQFKATFRDFDMKEATPEIEELIAAFREKYGFVTTDREWVYTDDNDELGTGSCYTSYDYCEIGDACVFLLFEGKIVGVAYPSHSGNMPVAWFHEENPGYHLHDDVDFYEKSGD